MARSANQKMKLLYIIKILTEKTDENHCMSAQDIIAELAAYDIFRTDAGLSSRNILSAH